MRWIWWLAMLGSMAGAAEPPAPKPFLAVTPEARGGEVVLVGKLQDCLCVSAEITAELTNMRATPPVPVQRDVTEARTTLTTLRPAEKGKKSNYTFAARFFVGRSGSRPDYGHVYRVPFPPVARFRLSQGYAGNFSHDPGSPMEFAVDWAMPEGTQVLAARDGTVVAFRADQTAGGPTEEFHDRVNLVVVEHPDGTLAEYLHLRPGGVAVKLGQKVAAGDLLGFSGATGYAREPQLQVRIYRIYAPGRDEGLPVRWDTRDRYEAPRKFGELPFRLDPLRFLREPGAGR
ncbi:MAG: M23 family metallopeptidase [Verrucomicrobia bacterium]|nr:M23 family metallopeptidase [Verrucomicrobiota bacterium]